MLQREEAPDATAGSGWSNEAYYKAIASRASPKQGVAGRDSMEVTNEGVGGVFRGLGMVLVAAVIIWLFKLFSKATTSVVSASNVAIGKVKRVVAESPSISGAHAQTSEYDHLYAQSLDELDRKTPDRACWAKALALCDGDEQRARGTYIKLRVSALQR